MRGGLVLRHELGVAAALTAEAEHHLRRHDKDAAGAVRVERDSARRGRGLQSDGGERGAERLRREGCINATAIR